MTRPASEIIDDYLAELRGGLIAGGADDADEVVSEIRSLLVDAATVGPQRAQQEIEQLGDPAELAQTLLVERGRGGTEMSSGVWWRLGIAAPIDILVGISLPIAAAIPLYVLAVAGHPRIPSVVLALALGAVALAWPFYVWRPWRRGGSRSPGMIITGIGIVRTTSAWRVVTVDGSSASGPSRMRSLALAVGLVLLAIVLLAGVSFVVLDVGGSWFVSAVGESE